MKISTLKLLLVLQFTLIIKYSSGQLAYDKLQVCKEMVAQDTITYYYEDDKGIPYYRLFPINSSISFKTELNDFILESSSAEISNDVLKIYLTKQAFGLIIDVIVQIAKNRLTAKISYWTALTNETRILKTEKAMIILNSKDLRSGDRLIGKVNIKFKGELLDELSMKEVKVSGEIDGCSNIQINRLLKSRLD